MRLLLDAEIVLIMAPERCCKVVKKLALSGELFFAYDLATGWINS